MIGLRNSAASASVEGAMRERLVLSDAVGGDRSIKAVMTRISADKAELRAQMEAQTRELTPDHRRGQSAEVCRWLMSELESSRRVLLYAPTEFEVDVWPLTTWLLDRKIQVALPRVEWKERRMAASAFGGDESTLERKGPGIRQPPAHAEVYPRDSLDAIVVPGVAFDARGCRLGRGGGFYDRFLDGAPGSVLTIGAGFTHQFLAQRVDSVPCEPHDHRMDAIVTPLGMMWVEISKAGGGR